MDSRRNRCFWVLLSSDPEPKGSCERFHSPKVVEEFDSFLRQTVNLFIYSGLLNYFQGFQFVEVLEQPVMRQVSSVQDPSGFGLVAFTLNHAHDVHVDSQLRSVLGRGLYGCSLIPWNHLAWFTLSSIANRSRNPKSCAVCANAKKTGTRVKSRKKRWLITRETKAPRTSKDTVVLLIL